ncbi:cytochrome P450 [Sistotremastrum niveocremeum HHB9708]|uniref:Cytochrome P450 n=1 Tax=Sistotremastrum niveocremeum HHB9708 TaxID=1314777 RepID=A0A164Y5Q8_9AGAM|nr:cytochrome P450 [Sistotremastrum niveocremeum HHB9708]
MSTVLTFLLFFFIIIIVTIHILLRPLSQGFIRPLLSPLRTLPGPKPFNYIWGSVKDIQSHDPGMAHLKWIKEFGNTFVFKGLFSINRLYTHDLRAVSHIISNPDTFVKAEDYKIGVSKLTGKGLIWAEGDLHKRQRRAMDPAFSTQNVKHLSNFIWDKALQLREIWLSQLDEARSATSSDDDIDSGYESASGIQWIVKFSFDVIGLAGFGHAFNFLQSSDGEEGDELLGALQTISKSGEKMSFLSTIMLFIPIARYLPFVPEREHAAVNALSTCRRVGGELIAARKQQIAEEDEDEDEKRKDLLSHLIRANISPSVPESMKLTDENVLDQIPTFLLAGHETTATSLSWTVAELSSKPAIQNKLRAEIVAAFPEESDFDLDSHPSYDEINSLPYLDGVVKEALRLYPTIQFVKRAAAKDNTVIPLSEDITLRDGSVVREVRLNKGDNIDVPIAGLQRDPKLWGEDALEFDPERWMDGRTSKIRLPGVVQNLMAFMGGAHGCIGYKFAIAEMKIFLFTFIRSFKVELERADMEIVRSSDVFITRPLVKGEFEKGNRLPLKVTAL